MEIIFHNNISRDSLSGVYKTYTYKMYLHNKLDLYKSRCI